MTDGFSFDKEGVFGFLETNTSKGKAIIDIKDDIMKISFDGKKKNDSIFLYIDVLEMFIKEYKENKPEEVMCDKCIKQMYVPKKNKDKMNFCDDCLRDFILSLGVAEDDVDGMIKKYRENKQEKGLRKMQTITGTEMNRLIEEREQMDDYLIATFQKALLRGDKIIPIF